MNADRAALILLLVGSAALLALANVDGWGWFLFIAALLL